MTPRGPAALTAAATSACERGTVTCARVGAVRPQPCRLAEEVGVLDIANEVTRPPLPPLSRSWFDRTRSDDAAPTVGPRRYDPLDRRSTSAPRLGGCGSGGHIGARGVRRGSGGHIGGGAGGAAGGAAGAGASAVSRVPWVALARAVAPYPAGSLAPPRRLLPQLSPATAGWTSRGSYQFVWWIRWLPWSLAHGADPLYAP